MKRLKTLKELHDEEFYRYTLYPGDPDIELEAYELQGGEFVRLKNGTIVFIEENRRYDWFQTVFPFPYSASIKGDYEKKLKEAQATITLDYAIKKNTMQIDFILEHLRTKPDITQGALFLVKEDQRLPDSTPFRVVRYYRTFPELFSIGNCEADHLELLKDIDDRKALYLAYKRVRKRIISAVRDWEKKYRRNAFRVIMYNNE